jgi:hypothetical protein
MAKLNKLDVTFISLVKDPANKLDIVYKGDGNTFTDTKQIAITKSTAEGLVYGTVYAPNVKDADGDWADAATIREAAHQFLLKGRNPNVDANHDGKAVGASVVESYVNPEGAWDVVIKMDPKNETFQRIQKGDLKGLSMYAKCVKSDEEPPAGEEKKEDGEVAKSLTELKEQIAKMAGEIEQLGKKVDRVPKTRQMIIDGDEVRITKGEGAEEAVFHEFDFGKLE